MAQSVSDQVVALLEGVKSTDNAARQQAEAQLQQLRASNARELYQGFIATSFYNHRGSSANALCMHSTEPQYPEGYNDGNENGNLLYGTEYRSTMQSSFDKNIEGDAACVVCSRGGYAKPYVQWGRRTCSNSHRTEYSGIMMGSLSTSYRGEHLCVSDDRAVHASSSYARENAGHLYPAQIRTGLPASAYPPHSTVAC